MVVMVVTKLVKLVVDQSASGHHNHVHDQVPSLLQEGFTIPEWRRKNGT